MRAKDELGAYGEREAARFLEALGMRLLDRNWRCVDGEIDLVALDGAVLVFCEVKTRSRLDFGDPTEAVGVAKAARIRRLGMRWMADRERCWRDVRFDIVAVLHTRGGATMVKHLKGAF